MRHVGLEDVPRLLGRSPPPDSSIRSSAGTSWFARKQVRQDRALLRPSEGDRAPPASTSRGPRTRNCGRPSVHAARPLFEGSSARICSATSLALRNDAKTRTGYESPLRCNSPRSSYRTPSIARARCTRLSLARSRRALLRCRASPRDSAHRRGTRSRPAPPHRRPARSRRGGGDPGPPASPEEAAPAARPPPGPPDGVNERPRAPRRPAVGR